MTFTGALQGVVAVLAVLISAVTIVQAEETNDYPTSARAEYVFGCLKANGETRQAIEQCSCSIDVVASIVPLRALCHGRNRAEHVAGAGQSRQPVPHVGAGGERAQ